MVCGRSRPLASTRDSSIAKPSTTSIVVTRVAARPENASMPPSSTTTATRRGTSGPGAPSSSRIAGAVIRALVKGWPSRAVARKYSSL
ncbi:MAG: hypothetical protein U1E53_04930 [Dongiaceae bacterium]